MPIETNVVSGSSGVPGGSSGFSTKLWIWPDSSQSIQPNAEASARGTRMPATVAPAPLSMWKRTICSGSIRYTWSAPKTTM
ncbi:hypothetical protein ATCCBAA256_18710 [Mycobacterium montefiorense]|nr:hypothetical protein ATCCBAA256_18710 [Mycobacterium montefiorense]